MWGNRYIDDAIAMYVDTDVDDNYEDAGGSERYFYLTDAQFSVVAVIDDAANLQERIQYDAYGEANHHDWRDNDGDGDYDSTDRTAISNIANGASNKIGEANYEVDCDLDRDGDVDLTDLSLATTNYPTALGKGQLSYDSVGNTIGYDGYIFNPATEQYTVRNRTYDPVMGRWIERDPAGYVDGMELYLFAGNLPSSALDPAGLWKIERNSTESRAIAIGEDGDSIRSLAQLIRLNASEYRSWLTVESAIRGPAVPISLDNIDDPDWSVCPGERYGIPNVVAMDKGDSVNWVLGTSMPGLVFPALNELGRKYRNAFKSWGYKVQVSDASNAKIKSHLRDGTESGELYVYIFLGHGDSGIINTHDGVGVAPDRYVSYGLSGMFLYACQSLVPALARNPEIDARPGATDNVVWRRNVSQSGMLLGFTTSFGCLELDDYSTLPGVDENSP